MSCVAWLALARCFILLVIALARVSSSLVHTLLSFPARTRLLQTLVNIRADSCLLATSHCQAFEAFLKTTDAGTAIAIVPIAVVALLRFAVKMSIPTRPRFDLSTAKDLRVTVAVATAVGVARSGTQCTDVAP